MKPLFIAGTSGLALEMFQLAVHCGRRPDGFIAERADQVGTDLGGARVVGDDQWLLARDEPADILLAVGHPEARLAVARRYAQRLAIGFPNFIHPRAMLDTDEVRLGVGNVVTAGCVMTVRISVGDFNLFNWNTTVGHEATIGSGNVINPQCSISGRVTIGDAVLLGTGSQVLEGRSIGDRAVVGAGSVVNRDVDAAMTVVGIPARPLPR